MTVVRVLSTVEAIDGACDSDGGCEREPVFAVQTPTGTRTVCENHLDQAVAAVVEDREAPVDV